MRPRDGRLGRLGCTAAAGGAAAVLPCIVDVGGRRGRRGGEVDARRGAAAGAAEDYGLSVARGARYSTSAIRGPCSKARE